MSVDPDLIDLNSQVADSLGPETEASVSEPVLAETLTSSVLSQVQAQAQVVDRVDVTVKNREMDSGPGSETHNGSVEEGCDKAKIFSLARCSSMKGVDGRSFNGKENGVAEIANEGKPEKSETLAQVVDVITAKGSPEVSSPKKDEILVEVVDGTSAERSSEVSSPKKDEILVEVVDRISAKESHEVSSPKKTDNLVEVVDGVSAEKSSEVSSPKKSETLVEVVDGITENESPEVSSPKKNEILAEVVDGISAKETLEVSSPKKSETLAEVSDGISLEKSPQVCSSLKDVDMSAANDVDVSGGVDKDLSFNQLVQGMEIDSPDEKSGIQMNSRQSSEEVRGLTESRSTSVDHDTSIDGDSSSDVEASSDDSKPWFTISDLVWAKVMSYPWWPGQIFDPSHASEKAKKMTKKDAYLVAYFGDDTFAWNNESKIKHFVPHFSHMERQSNSAEFLNAVNCALEEVSRRTELSLSCSCSSRFRNEEVATEGTSNYSFSNAPSFKPSELVEFLRGLAPSPLYETADRLQLMTSQAQLLAFNRWKGYPELPRFEILLGTLEGSAEIPPSEEVNGGSVPGVNSGENRVSGGNISSGDKEKSLAELLAETKLKLKNGKKGPSSKPEIKHKSVSLGNTADNGSTQKRKKSSSSETANDRRPSKQAFRVGASILKVASQMTCASSLLKNGDGNATKSAVKNKRQRKGEK